MPVLAFRFFIPSASELAPNGRLSLNVPYRSFPSFFTARFYRTHSAQHCQQCKSGHLFMMDLTIRGRPSLTFFKSSLCQEYCDLFPGIGARHFKFKLCSGYDTDIISSYFIKDYQIQWFYNKLKIVSLIEI